MKLQTFTVWISTICKQNQDGNKKKTSHMFLKCWHRKFFIEKCLFFSFDKILCCVILILSFVDEQKPSTCAKIFNKTEQISSTVLLIVF